MSGPGHIQSADRRPAEIGLGIQGDKPFVEYGRLAGVAEQHGVDVLTMFADLWYQPPLGALLSMAGATTTARLGAACWNPYVTHPYDIAGQVAVLDEASSGRAYVGLARGAWLGDIRVGQHRPITVLREAATLIDTLLRGDTSGFDGEVFALAPGRRFRTALPPRRPPMLFGTWGPQAAAVAGELADEVKIGGTANPAMVAVMRQRVAPGEQRAGRSPGAVRVVVGAVTVVANDAAAARRLARQEVALYLPVVAELDPTVTLPADLVARVRAAADRGEYERAGRLIPDDVLDLFCFSGAPDDVAAQAQALIDAGADRVEFGTPHGFTAIDGVELIGRHVVSQLRREPATASGRT